MPASIQSFFFLLKQVFAMSLLPQDHSEFRSKQYWDEFFQKRENVAFEWYGDFTEVSAHLLKSVTLTDKVLVIGCGNSDFSSDFYDKGYQNVTNLDFSELVIQEMISKNMSRDKMKWDVGDMTNLSAYPSGSFNVVFDKGALDALMSTDTTEVREKAICMFQEINRVLANNGKYVCITLAEKFIIETLINYYTNLESLGFSISVDSIQSKKESPFLPFYIEITKTISGSSISNDKCIRLHLDEFGAPFPASTNRLTLPRITGILAIAQLNQIQEFHQKQFQLAKLEVGRFEKLQFWSEEHPEIPRFTIFLLDHSDAPQVTLSMAVFMVPVGRESDFQFTTADGLRDIASQANCKRLLAVCCNRPHVYPEMKELQAELNPIVLSLKLKAASSEETIPYMAINTESDWDTIDSGHSESGDYIIEESFDEDLPNTVLRRLIFLQNQNFIQTEVRLVMKKNNAGPKKTPKGKKKSAKKTTKSAPGEEEFEFDYTYLDAHHCAALASLAMLPEVVNTGHKVANPHTAGAVPAATANAASTSVASGNSAVQGPSALLVGLGGGALPMCLQRYLPNLHLYMCDLDSSLEGVAKEHFGFKCNTRSTAFVADGIDVISQVYSRLNSGNCAADGAIPASLGASPLDMLFIDADSKDTTLGISAPPAAFLTLRTLLQMYAILKPGGAVYFNVVARSKAQLAQVVAKLATIFNVDTSSISNRAYKVDGQVDLRSIEAEVAAARAELNASLTATSGAAATDSANVNAARGKMYHIQASNETMNEGLLVIKGSAGSVVTGSAASTTVKSGANSRLSICYDREALLEFWLKSVGMGGDPLKLTEMLDLFREIRL